MLYKEAPNESIAPETKAKCQYGNVRDIQALFKHEVSPKDLKELRNQLSLKHEENNVSANDARVILAKEWLESSPAGQDIFNVLDKGAHPTVIAICVSLLSCLLSLTSLHYVNFPLGQPIVKKMLTPQYLRRFDTWISGSNSEMCLSALKLAISMSNFGGKGEQKSVLLALTWDVKVFHKLLYMRRKGKSAEQDSLSRPDIRTLCLQFILSFVSSSSGIKTLFLEQHRDIFLSIFKGLPGDPYPVVQHVLEILWTDLWQDQKVKRTLKVGLFGETTLQHLLKIYERDTQDSSGGEATPADVIHHFLLAISTHRGVGVCFADNGWYPRRDDEENSGKNSGKIYNKILANLIKSLKVTDDARQQELALGILRACPELVSGYIQSVGLTTEPRLSSKWLANIAFLSSIAALPVPIETFKLPVGIAGPSTNNGQQMFQPSPPPLQTIIDNIIPSANIRPHLTKALQSRSPLVQHQAGIALAQCLQKCQAVFDTFRYIEKVLEEDIAEGQWARRRLEVEREIRKRVPEFQVIIAFSGTNRLEYGLNNPLTIKTAMMSELSQRLLWLYHQCLPSLVLEARYDIGKSLQCLSVSEGWGDLPPEIAGFVRLEQLHVLRMLRESDQFVWYAKSAPSTSSNILILLRVLLETKQTTMKATIISLLVQSLKDSLLFQHNPDELRLWLKCILHTVQHPAVTTAEILSESDHRRALLVFLDDCMQRCAKTPYKYLEEMHSLQVSEEIAAENASIPATGPFATTQTIEMSPLMMTVVEQLAAKIRGSLLSASELITILNYLRNAVVSLLGNQNDMRLSQAILRKVRTIVTETGYMDGRSSISEVLAREFSIMSTCINRCGPGGGDEKDDNDLPEVFIHDSVMVPDRYLLQQDEEADSLDNFSIEQYFQHEEMQIGEFKRLAGIILHRLRKALTDSLLKYLALIALNARRKLNIYDFSAFKRFIYTEKRTGYNIWTLRYINENIMKGIRSIQDSLLDNRTDTDCQIVSHICQEWLYSLMDVDDISNSPREAIPWIRYIRLESQLNLFGHLLDKSKGKQNLQDSTTWLLIVEELSTCFIKSKSSLVSKSITEQIPDIIRLRSLFPASVTVERLLSHAAEESLPLGFNGVLALRTQSSLKDAIDVSERRWNVQRVPFTELYELQTLIKGEWTHEISKAISSLITRSLQAQRSFEEFLVKRDREPQPSVTLLAPALLAYFTSVEKVGVGEAIVKKIYEEIIRGFLHDDLYIERVSLTSCIASMAEKVAYLRNYFFDCLRREISALPTDKLAVEALCMVRTITRIDVHGARLLVGAMIDHTLDWCIYYLAGNEETVDNRLLEDAHQIVREAEIVLSRSAETVISLVIRHHLLLPSAVSLAEMLFAKMNLKPANVNRLLQSILQHPLLEKVAALDAHSKGKTAICNLIFRLFHAHPGNTCQPSHIIPLVSLYRGSLSIADCKLLAVFRLYEEQRRSSIASIFSAWMQSSTSSPRSLLDSVLDLDPHRVLRTCLAFPDRHSFSAYSEADQISDYLKGTSSYDPVFILALFSQALLEGPPKTALAWVSTYRTNVVSLIIRCLSSRDPSIRRFSVTVLGHVWTLMQGADMQEKAHVINLLDLLRDQVNVPTDSKEDIPRLPSYTSLLLAHALRGIFYPQNFIYPITARFLLQRAELDITDVPMLFSLLYSSSDNWKKERAWMIRYLADGMQDSDDWRILKRRHTWDLLASLYQSSFDDHVLRHGILEVLANLTCSSQATTSLLLKSSLSQWIEMQLHHIKGDERLAWIKIIENILVVVNSFQVEHATKGEWELSLLRCLVSLLHDADFSALRMASRCLTRFHSERLHKSVILRTILVEAFDCLTEFERQSCIQLSQKRAAETEELDTSFPLPPHRNHTLFQPPSFPEDLRSWGSVVENLWSVCMTHEIDGPLWNKLSCRLLLLRGAVGSLDCRLGEWIRQEVISAMRNESS